jgi:hypothetical protein
MFMLACNIARRRVEICITARVVYCPPQTRRHPNLLRGHHTSNIELQPLKQRLLPQQHTVQ